MGCAGRPTWMQPASRAMVVCASAAGTPAQKELDPPSPGKAFAAEMLALLRQQFQTVHARLVASIDSGTLFSARRRVPPWPWLAS